MSALWNLLMFLVVVKSALGEKQEENTCSEFHRAIEKIDQLDTSFNELKQMIMDNSLYAASRDAIATLRRREQRDTTRSRTRREKEDLHLGNVFVTLYDTAIQTSSDVKILLENQAFCDRPKSCLEHLRNGHTESGVYKIYTAKYAEAIEVNMHITTRISLQTEKIQATQLKSD